MMRFSRSKAGQKGNERKGSQKEKKDVKESQFGSQFDPLFATSIVSIVVLINIVH